MKLRSWTRMQLAGLVFIAVGLMNLLTADLLLGGVWALLGLSLIAYVSPSAEPDGRPRRFEPTPRNLLALAAALAALVLLVAEIAVEIASLVR